MRSTQFAALGAFGLLLVLAGVPQAAAQSSASEPVPIVVGEGEQAQPIQFSRVEIAVPRSKVIGKISKCLAGVPVKFGEDITYTGAGGRDREFNSVFVGELRAANYHVVGDPNSLFNEPELTDANYVVAGRIDRLHVSACLDRTLIVVNNIIANTTVSVLWQVYSRLNKKVVFETVTDGVTRVSGHQDIDAALDRSILDAFASATRGLLADQAFHDLVTGAAATPDGPQSPDGAPAALYEVKYIPLSEKRFQDQVTDIRAHVVTVFAGGGHGSGFFINDGYLLTNWHVVQDATFVKISTVTGREILGEVLVSNAARDVALVKTESVGLPGLPMRMEDPHLTSEVFVIGTPLDPALQSSVSTGIVSAFRNSDEGRLIQSDVNIQPGNSGGPMFDENGNVIGITVSGHTNQGVPAGINLFIPLSLIHI